MSMDILGLTTVQEMREAHHLKSPKGISLDAGGGGGLIQNSSGVSMEIPATPFTPKTNTKSELGPYPTTFVQADTSNFKQIVQMLTGSSETVTKQHQQSSKSLIPPIRAPPKRIHMQQHQGFKLYERRNQYSHQLKNNALIINTLIPGLAGTGAGDFSPRNKAEILSPSTLDFPKLALSPVTPLLDPFNNPSSSPYSICSTSTPSSEEERAIAEKGFYLHPSPISTPGGAEPQLLPLFPVTSPRASA
ncbi:hypothetical protein SAY87_004137 [Trapa incisa]|uniref:VQ domain-containing protein n=1 Tax=Trapa incisa TaxID=236973 RepID=A0AAN7JNZ7_9MYRT|nr:hypothetical protein SAY87_004137 [Trapa incisa]